MLRALAALLLAASPAWGAGPVEVVTTSTDLKSLVEAVGGDLVRVASLAPAVHEPHIVEVKPSQLAQLRSAALLVRVGLDHEPWLVRVLEAVNDARFRPGGPDVLDCSKGIALLQSETPRVRDDRGVHVHGFGNPHYWLDPDNARPITAGIRDALARIDPAHRQRFEDNRAGFLSVLDARLVRWSEAMAPYQGTRAVVVHDTWPYFAKRFGLIVVAAVEPSPGVPPSAAYLADLVKRMRSSGVKLIIAGPESNAAMVRLIAAQTGALPVTLVSSVGGDPEARTYVTLFDVDVKRLTGALAPR